MKHLPFILLIATAIVLGIATFVEDSRGSAFIHSAVYGAWWFKVLWAAVAASALWQLWRQRLYRRVAACGLHAGLLLVLLGGLVTALTQQSGVLHLRQGQSATHFLAQSAGPASAPDHRALRPLPFAVRLDTFFVQYYPGTEAPQDYVSRISIGPPEDEGQSSRFNVQCSRFQVSMNRIVRHRGYRLYQSSYDPDGQGSWLTVTFDPYGSAIAYAGFLLFTLAAIGVLLGRQSGFRTLLRQFMSHSAAPVALVALLLGVSPSALAAANGSAEADAALVPCVARAEADSMSARLVTWNDRVCPFNTLATDFVKKIYGKRRCKGYTPEQVVLSWQRYPDAWNRLPLIRVKSAELRRRLGMTDACCSYVSLFDENGQYRLQPLWNEASDKHSKLAQAIQQTDEKAALISMLQGGTLIQMAHSAHHATLTPSRIRAELLYNRVPFVSILFMANLTIGMLCFLLLFVPRCRRFLASPWLCALLVLSLLTLFFAYVLRWYVSGRVPLSNGFETMMFAALAIQIIALVLRRRVPIAVAFGFLLTGFLLLVAHLGYMNPQITNLMPVLNSPWLSSHVSIIMVAYALLGFTFLGALTALLLPRQHAQQLTLLNRLLLYPAVLLLFVGIFLGSVWANVSWGTYWSWDPKEVWALITAIVYAIPLHGQSLAWVRSERRFNLYLLFAFLTVLMTYFGVNFLLGGMHSYAN